MARKDWVLIDLSNEDRAAAMNYTTEEHLADEERHVLAAIEGIGQDLSWPEYAGPAGRAAAYRNAIALLELAIRDSYLGRVRQALDVEAAEAAED